MRTLIGALLAVTALSPTLAGAQGWRAGAEAQAGRDGPRDGGLGRGPDARDDRDTRPGPRQVAGGRFGRDDDRRPAGQDPQRPPALAGERTGDRLDRRGADGRPGDGRPRDGWADRGGPRGDDRNDPRGYDRPNDRGDRSDGPDRRRAANEWNRGRLDARDDGRARYGFADRAAWNRGWRGDDRYDWNGYRTTHRGAYRLPRYYAPGGGGYRRIGIGVGLQVSLWNRSYWIDDPYAYRLPQAYGPYRWVRYYDDALLVDLNSGRVVDAVYGIFW